MKHTICFLLAAWLMLAAAPAGAELYYWLDENGVKHFSNEPPPKDVGEYHKASETKYNPHLDKSRMARDRQWQEEQSRRIQNDANKIIEKQKTEAIKEQEAVKRSINAEKQAEELERIEVLERRVRNSDNIKKKKLKYKLEKAKKKYQELYHSQPETPTPRQ